MDSPIPEPIPRSIPLKPLTPRQERFCHYFVLYACASVAASEAGYARKSAKNQGYRMLRTGRVRDRIRELHAEACRDQAGDTEALIGKLENVYRRAVQDHHFHTAARCVELQARLATLKQGRDPLPALPKLPPAPLDAKRLSPAGMVTGAEAVVARASQAGASQAGAGENAHLPSPKRSSGFAQAGRTPTR